ALATIGFALVCVSFSRPLILDHCATGTRRQWNRVHQRITFIDFYQHRFPLHLGGPPFIKYKSILTGLLRGWPQQAATSLRNRHRITVAPLQWSDEIPIGL